MEDAKRQRSTTTDGRPPAQGYEDAPTPRPHAPDGQAEAYWVLSDAERAKGFVRPVRRSYEHVGPPGSRHALRDLTPEEQQRHAGRGYVKYEPYPDDPDSAVTGRFWTQAQLDGVGRGCGTVTTMGLAIAETYAREPGYYGSTFCVHCRKHLPVGKYGVFVWEDGSRVGT